ncbi:MAG: hypothetical protein HQ518_22005 [Rhodopirellula sp.]|nr:hypothetical protein [Rhodopirellula sp.]
MTRKQVGSSSVSFCAFRGSQFCPCHFGMNYFSHAIRFLDRPVFAVSTGLPDMLSVADRSVRLRSRRMEPFLETASPFETEVAAGALQHLEDDAWFHKTRAFLETSAELTRLFRDTIGAGDGMRCSFLGHIVTELQLDGVLAERYPTLLDRYYELMGDADAVAIQSCVNRMAAKQTERLAVLIPKFHQEQFLRDYSDPSRLRFRLNQVMLRVRLESLPEVLEEALAESWRIVESRAEVLLPPEYFEFPAR